MERRYGQWAGNPKGKAEDPKRCTEEVWDNFVPHQCRYKRGKGKDGLFCGIHAKRNPAEATEAQHG